MTENEQNQTFRSLYEKVKSSYLVLKVVPDEDINGIEVQLNNTKSIEKTNIYISAIIAAVIFYITFPFITTKLFASLSVVTEYLLYKKGSFSKELKITLNSSFGISAFSILVYLFIIPNVKLLNERIIGPINRKQANFVFISIIFSYFAIGLILLLLYLNVEETSKFIAENFKFYLMIPLFVLFLLLFLVLIIMILIFPFKKILLKDSDQLSNKRIEISVELMKTLKKIEPYDNFYFLAPKDHDEIFNSLSKVNRLIRHYPSGISTLNLDQIKDDFSKASLKFEETIICFMSTKKSHVQEIKVSLVDYLNIFLSGDLSDLPKSDVTIEKDKKRKTKFIHFVLLGLYLTLPIITVITLKIFFKITLDDYLQSLLRILYVVWAFVGIFANPVILNDENKDLIKDIIKTITGKA